MTLSLKSTGSTPSLYFFAYIFSKKDACSLGPLPCRYRLVIDSLSCLARESYETEPQDTHNISTGCL